MVTVPCWCSRCAGNRWSLNVASHMVWARQCPLHNTNAHCSVCSVLLHWPCQTHITHCAFDSDGYQIQMHLSQVCAASTSTFHCRGQRSEDKTRETRIINKQSDRRERESCVRQLNIIFMLMMFRDKLLASKSKCILSHLAITEHWSLCISGGGDGRNLKNSICCDVGVTLWRHLKIKGVKHLFFFCKSTKSERQRQICIH